MKLRCVYSAVQKKVLGNTFMRGYVCVSVCWKSWREKTSEQNNKKRMVPEHTVDTDNCTTTTKRVKKEEGVRSSERGLAIAWFIVVVAAEGGQVVPLFLHVYISLACKRRVPSPF
jgi:hypothetical protein